MTLTARGHIVLDGVTLTSDPETYELQWTTRNTVHQGVGGAVTIQDFGKYAKDLALRLVSGASQYLDIAVVRLIQTKTQTKGATYSFTDWLGNTFTVFIKSFAPQPTFLPDLFTWTLELQVVTVTNLYGVTYVGS